MDSARPSTRQFAGRRVAPPPDKRNRKDPERRPHCTTRRAAAPRGTRAHSKCGNSSLPQPEKLQSGRPTKKHAVPVQAFLHEPTREPAHSPPTQPRECELLSA